MKTHTHFRLLPALCLTAITAALATPALADGHRGRHHGYNDYYNNGYDNGRTVYARVTMVTPIYQSVSYRAPVSSCWTESRAYSSGGYQSHTPMILGTLIGGALGNELGHDNGNKKVGAVLGGVLGGSIGRDVGSRNSYGGTTRYVDEEVCDTRYQTEYEERIVGYNVHYFYEGREYRTRTDYHPGKRIPINVHVRPAY